eukprot:158956_1
MSYFSAEIVRWFDTNLRDIGSCERQYKTAPGFIPRIDRGRWSLLIVFIMDFIVLLFIAIYVVRIEKGNNYLIPFYKSILYAYSAVVLFSCIFEIIKFISFALHDVGGSDLHDAEKLWILVVLRVLKNAINDAIQIVMLFIIWQDRVKYDILTVVIASIIFVFVCLWEGLQHHFYLQKNLNTYSLFNLIENIIPCVIYMFIFLFIISKSRCRYPSPSQARNRIIFWYSLSMIFILSW